MLWARTIPWRIDVSAIAEDPGGRAEWRIRYGISSASRPRTAVPQQVHLAPLTEAEALPPPNRTSCSTLFSPAITSFAGGIIIIIAVRHKDERQSYAFPEPGPGRAKINALRSAFAERPSDLAISRRPATPAEAAGIAAASPA